MRVGLIGCGRIARAVHLNILKSMRGVELVALAEVDQKNREKAYQQTGVANLFSDYESLLRESAVDAVVICLPNALHAEAAIAAFQEKKHVYLEKPLAMDLEEARKILASWRESKYDGHDRIQLSFQ